MIKKIFDWLLSTEKIHSAKNGEIKINRFFGQYDVECGGCYQSGPYVTSLWKTALKNIPLDDANFHPKNILMLGLGGGGGTTVIRKKFPKANITVVEHDEEMVKIAARILFSKIKFSPHIILDDAKSAVEKLINQNKKFDIVIIDLFNGLAISPILYEDDFVDLIQKVLNYDGYLLVNFYRRKKLLLPIFSKHFAFWKSLKYKYNQMGIFRPFGNGNVGDPIPNEFAVREQSNIFADVVMRRNFSPAPVGENGRKGIRYSFGKFSIEYYKTDIEPIIEKWKGIRFVIWYPVSRTKKIKGWTRNFFIPHGWQLGFTHVSQDYLKSWSDHAKRHKKIWDKQSKSEYELFKTDIDTFQKAYFASKKLSDFLRKAFMHAVRVHHSIHPETIDFILIKKRQNDKVVAGFITIDYPDVKQSVHTISFIVKGEKKTSVGYGLIADWYERSLRKGLSYLNYGLVYKKGDPKAWRGYSKFKRQFGLFLIKFPRPYLKLTIG